MTDHPFRSSTLTPPTAPPSPPIDGGNVFMWLVRIALLALLGWGMVRGVGCVRSCNARVDASNARIAASRHRNHLAGARAWLRDMHRDADTPIQCRGTSYYDCIVWPRGEPVVKLQCASDEPYCVVASEVRP